MRQKRMYLSGPISGQEAVQVAKRFADALIKAEERGFMPVNPLNVYPKSHEGPCPPGRPGLGGHNEVCHLRADIHALTECDAILLLPGWVHSWGVRLELQIATAIGLEVWEQMTNGAIYPLAWDEKS